MSCKQILSFKICYESSGFAPFFYLIMLSFDFGLSLFFCFSNSKMMNDGSWNLEMADTMLDLYILFIYC
uniref:Putative ovule protein n=1 Tax=Solanum chacoense TaxID=4108 RepID=A0A0V0GM55_SOLCH